MLVQLRTKARPAVAEPPLVREEAHVFDTAHGAHVLVSDGSRIYSISAGAARSLRENPGQATERLEALGLLKTGVRRIDDEAPRSMPTRSLSLAIAQKCNLACTYCYAQEGGFGVEPQSMDAEVGLASVDLLFRDVAPNERVNLAFLGGEPLINRALLQACTQRATELAELRGARVGFSITTNGTLIGPEDAEFFERHGFAVTISLDGVGEVHDRQRPHRGGQGSYERIIRNVSPLLRAQRRMQVSARVTVTPENLRLRETLDELLGLGFHSVGFSPMLRSPTRRGEMHQAELQQMLEQMIDCGEETLRRTIAGERYAFSNLLTAIQQIHRGTHRPYPCGAGAGYFGVSAKGELYACHRFVEEPNGRFGDVWSGVERERQQEWLQQRHVHQQQPCSGCWARYLCGGGCHHEVLERGRPACDYIRGWLDYCLKAYVRLKVEAPAYLVPGLDDQA